MKFWILLAFQNLQEVYVIFKMATAFDLLESLLFKTLILGLLYFS